MQLLRNYNASILYGRVAITLRKISIVNNTTQHITTQQTNRHECPVA